MSSASSQKESNSTPMVVLPAVGKPNQLAPRKSRMIPRKNVGSDHMNRLNVSAPTSSAVRFFQAARARARPRSRSTATATAAPARWC